MYRSGASAKQIVAAGGLGQISDAGLIASLVAQVLRENPQQVESYMNGKQGVSRWLFGQVMRAAQGRAAPQIIQRELDRQLAACEGK
jgi:aspartyl-tRNA(Asn)/glutamyl-tRNA(Gln) amidotransferase subunit B